MKYNNKLYKPKNIKHGIKSMKKYRYYDEDKEKEKEKLFLNELEDNYEDEEDIYDMDDDDDFTEDIELEDNDYMEENDDENKLDENYLFDGSLIESNEITYTNSNLEIICKGNINYNMLKKFDLDIKIMNDKFYISKDLKKMNMNDILKPKIAPYFFERKNVTKFKGFVRIEYSLTGSKREFTLPPSIISNGLYCNICKKYGPNAHLYDCSNPTIDNLYITVDGFNKAMVVYEYNNTNVKTIIKNMLIYSEKNKNKRSENDNLYVIKSSYINRNNPLLTTIKYNDLLNKKKHKFFAGSSTLTYIDDNYKVYKCRIWNINDQYVKMTINSNPWSNINFYKLIIEKLNGISDVPIELYLSKISTLNVIFNYKEHHKFVSINKLLKGLLNLKVNTYKFNNDIYGLLHYNFYIKKSINNSILLYIYNVNKNNSVGPFKATIQLYQSRCQITFSLAGKKDKIYATLFKDYFYKKYNYINYIDDYKSLITNEINKIYYFLIDLLNVIIKNDDKIFGLIKHENEQDLYGLITINGKIPYKKKNIFDKFGILRNKAKSSKYQIFDLNVNDWVPKICYIKNQDVNNPNNVIVEIINTKEIISINPSLLRNYEEAIYNGLSVCRNILSDNHNIRYRPEPYSFLGKCPDGALSYINQNGCQSKVDNRFYPCCTNNLSEKKLNQYISNYILYGNNSNDSNLMPKSQYDYDQFVGTFLPNTIYKNAIVDVLKNGVYIPVKIISRKKSRKSTGTKEYIFQVQDIKTYEYFYIYPSDFHPKYRDNRKFDGLLKIFNNNSYYVTLYLIKLCIDFNILYHNNIGPYSPINLNNIPKEYTNLIKQYKPFNIYYLCYKNIILLSHVKYIGFYIPKYSIESILFINKNTSYIINKFKQSYSININIKPFVNDSLIIIKGFLFNNHFYIVKFINTANNILTKINNLSNIKLIYNPIHQLISLFNEHNIKEHNIYLSSTSNLPKYKDISYFQNHNNITLPIKHINSNYYYIDIKYYSHIKYNNSTHFKSNFINCYIDIFGIVPQHKFIYITESDNKYYLGQFKTLQLLDCIFHKIDQHTLKNNPIIYSYKNSEIMLYQEDINKPLSKNIKYII